MPSNNTTVLGGVAKARDDNKDLSIAVPNEITQDSAWSYPVSIDDLRWNQFYPFAVVLLQKVGNGWNQVPSSAYTLPIGPESLQQTMTPATVLSITQGGVVEELNGSPVRSLNISSTTGVFPLRGTGGSLPSNSLRLPTNIFAGLINGVVGIAAAAQTAVQAIQGSTPSNLINFQTGNNELRGTGYFQILMLNRWFEQYLALKKTTGGSKFALGFLNAKEKILYRCTLTSFNVQRSASSPHEYPFSISFKVWGSQELDSTPHQATANSGTNMRSPSALSSTLAVISSARRTLAALNNTLGGIRGDADTVFDAMRQTAFFVKDALGVAITAADLPASIVRDMKSAIIEFATIPANARNIQRVFQQVKNEIDDTAVADFTALLQQLGSISGKDVSKAGTLATTQQALSGAHAANKILDNPQNYPALFEVIIPGQLKLAPTTVKAIRQQRETIRQLKQIDFENFRDKVQAASDSFAASIGAMDPRYAAIYGLPVPVTTHVPTDDDFQAMEALSQSVMELSRMALEPDITNQVANSMQFMANLAAQSQIPFTVPVSKYAIPVPFGSTLEMMAARYLGDTNRWLEIAALNDLRSPYIDEVGFDLPLITNGILNYVIIGDVSQLYTGQTVYLSSTATSRTIRTIIGIVPSTPTTWQVSLSGAADLARFTTVGLSTLHAFLPHTLNSNNLIFIPSQTPTTPTDFIGKPNPEIASANNFLLVGGADLLLTPKGDLVITPTGDTPLAIGLQNIIQRARIAFSTPQGSLLEHPTFGIPLQPGISIADLNAQEVVSATRNLFDGDSAFISVSNVGVSINGPTATLNCQIDVTGSNSPLPLSFELPTTSK